MFKKSFFLVCLFSTALLVVDSKEPSLDELNKLVLEVAEREAQDLKEIQRKLRHPLGRLIRWFKKNFTPALVAYGAQEPKPRYYISYRYYQSGKGELSREIQKMYMQTYVAQQERKLEPKHVKEEKSEVTACEQVNCYCLQHIIRKLRKLLVPGMFKDGSKSPRTNYKFDTLDSFPKA